MDVDLVDSNGDIVAGCTTYGKPFWSLVDSCTNSTPFTAPCTFKPGPLLYFAQTCGFSCYSGPMFWMSAPPRARKSGCLWTPAGRPHVTEPMQLWGAAFMKCRGPSPTVHLWTCACSIPLHITTVLLISLFTDCCWET